MTRLVHTHQHVTIFEKTRTTNVGKSHSNETLALLGRNYYSSFYCAV